MNEDNIQKSLDSSRVTTPDPVGDLPRIRRHIHHGAACDCFSRAHGNIA